MVRNGSCGSAKSTPAPYSPLVVQRLLDVITAEGLAMDNGAPRLRILLAVVGHATKLIEAGELAHRIEHLEEVLRSKTDRISKADLAGSLLDDEQ